MRPRRPIASALAALAFAATPVVAQIPPDYLVRQLTPPGEATSHVTSHWKVGPRGEWIAFAGDVEIAGAEAVYAMRRNGSELHRLSGYGSIGAVSSVAFTPDGVRVIYSGDLETNDRFEIWSVLLPGSPASAVKLNQPVTGGGVSILHIPDQGSRILYLAETASGRVAHSVPFAGPASAGTDLNPAAVGAEETAIVELVPDGTKALVVMYDAVAETSRIFSVPIAGPAGSAVLLADSDPGGCLYIPGPVSQDSTKMVYLGSCPDPGGNPFQEAWSVPLAGPAGAAVSLAGSFADGGAIQSILISPDGQRVVFTADRLVDERFELWSVPFAGPAASLVRLNPTLAANGDVQNTFEISSDSARVVYVADQQLDTYSNGYVVPIEGPSSAAVRLYLGPTMVAGDVLEARFSPDGANIVFRGDYTVDERMDLHWSPGDGATAPYRITNRGAAPGRSVSGSWLLDPAGERVFYIFDESAPDDRRGLGEQRVSGPYATDLRLNGTPVAGGEVAGFELYPDGAGLLYDSDETAFGKLELFTVDTRIFGDGFEEGTTAAWADLP